MSIKIQILYKNAWGNRSFKQKAIQICKRYTVHYDLEKLVFYTSKF